MDRVTKALVLVFGIALVAAACSGGGSGSSAENATADDTGTQVEFDPANFVDPTTSTNPYHPLTPGTQWVRGGTTEVGSRVVPHEIITTMTDVVREIEGVPAVAMLDESTDSGEIAQRSIDYMALDKDGNVWILGGYTEDYEGGEYTNTDTVWMGTPAQAPCGVGGPMKLLVVEDEKKVATAVRRGLEAEGFAVDVALDGVDGLWMATENDYEALVLDIMLPGKNGYEICAALREAGDWTPVLMLTAKDGEHDEAEALDTGADDYLTKPFSFVVLVARVRALLRRSTRSARPPVEAGDLRIDPARHRCARGDVEISLTAREFSVLEFLVRRAGQVVPKSEILDGVWDYDFEGDPNIVEVYIRHLRRKIDEPFGRTSIETIRGAGYRLEEHGG